MGAGSKKHKGPRARERERLKGAKQGPKRIGATKPPSGVRSALGTSSRMSSKKAKKAAATAAAWALVDGGDRGKHNKSAFAY